MARSTVSIRAYGAQAAFRRESFVRIDRYSRASTTFWALNWYVAFCMILSIAVVSYLYAPRWISVIGQVLAGAFSSALAAYLVYGQRFDASTTGFSLTMSSAYLSPCIALDVADRSCSQLLLADNVVGPRVQRI